MPIYDYQCRGCGEQFELLVLPSKETVLACPACESLDIEQQISSFAVSSKEISKANLKVARKKFAVSKDHIEKTTEQRRDVIAHLEEHYGDGKDKA